MRYHLESTLPIHAFQPLGGRHSPFKHGMTLEGGGGGIIESIGDAFSGVAEGIGDALAGVDSFVGDTIPGGWGTIAAIAVPYAAPMITGAALTAGQAAALAAGTRAATGAIRGEDPEDILKGAALAGATSYGLGSLGGESIDLPSETPYVDMSDTGTLLTPESVPLEAAVQTSPSPSYETNINDLGAGTSSYGEANELPNINEVSPPELTPKGTLSLEEQFAKDNYLPPELRSPDYVDPTYIPAELNLGNLYQNLPDGATQLGYSPDELAAITSSSTPSTLSPEEETLKRMQSYYEGADILPEMTQNFPRGGIPLEDLYSATEGAVTRPSFLQDPVQNITNRATDTLDYLKNAPENAYKYLRDTPIKEMGSDLYDFAGRNKLELGLGALALSGMGSQQPQPQGQPAGYASGYSPYTGGYGSSGGVADPYLLRERINVSNIYNYRNPYTSRYAQGGEVKHFALGGISNAITRLTQPIEKAIVQPVGQALPFLKDVAPYAGILAAPFITSPAMAVGVGALSSGFGRPGTGFDMKRALMGGIAAYGASTVGAGLEAAGTEPTKPLVDTLAESYAVPGTEVPVSTAAPKGFFRDTDAMQRGVGNLLSSDSDAATKAFATKAGTSKGMPDLNVPALAATKAFATKAGTFKSGIPLVMGTSGMMAIDEANKMREEAERSAGVGRQEQADMLARISKGRKRAEEAVRANPYMYAMGGSVDDELGGDYSAMGMDQGNMQKGLFGLGYAAGGTPRFLSGGGDGMSDSIPATIGGTQEARLADGEFVIPADVVSHLGNGSSKAGAKQLYSMMDRVRKARTGNEKQGRQIKPSKLMPA